MTGRSERTAHAPLEVWLEPGYDGGALGAWVPALPGAFAVATTPERAVTAILTNTARTRAWLEAHDDDAGLPPLGRVEIVGEVAAEVQPDGSERNATLPTDRRPLHPGELEAAARRLGWQREDTARVAEEVDRLEPGGPPTGRAGDADRSAAAMLSHLAGAAAWYVEQVGGARYAGSPADTAPAAELEAAYAWALGRLAVLEPSDDGREVAAERGETWTLAKVVRRLVYHGFDHLWELERRLALADGTRERVEVRLDRRPAPDVMAGLLRSVGWDARAADPELFGRAIAGTAEFAAAWDDDRLVGTARAITDGAVAAHIATVVVEPRYQGLGIGERLMHALMDGRDHMRFVLSAAPGMEAWYAKLGFVADHRAMVRRS